MVYRIFLARSIFKLKVVCLCVTTETVIPLSLRDHDTVYKKIRKRATDGKPRMKTPLGLSLNMTIYRHSPFNKCVPFSVIKVTSIEKKKIRNMSLRLDYVINSSYKISIVVIHDRK